MAGARMAEGSPADAPWRIAEGGLTLSVRLTPKGGRDSIDGVERLSDGTPVLKARVRAAPQEGEANAALEKLVAKALGVPASRVRLTAGATARLKTLKIEGDAMALVVALTKIGNRTAA
jgi:uncharacterized protein YggU (UPF0235/DUF167 family)